MMVEDGFWAGETKRSMSFYALLRGVWARLALGQGVVDKAVFGVWWVLSVVLSGVEWGMARRVGGRS